MVGKISYNPLATIGGVILFKYLNFTQAISDVYPALVEALRGGNACVLDVAEIERISEDRELLSLPNKAKIYGATPREVLRVGLKSNIDQYRSLITETETAFVDVAYILNNGDIRMKLDKELATVSPMTAMVQCSGLTIGKFGADAAKNFEMIINHSSDIIQVLDVPVNVSIYELMAFMPEMLTGQFVGKNF